MRFSDTFKFTYFFSVEEPKITFLVLLKLIMTSHHLRDNEINFFPNKRKNCPKFMHFCELRTPKFMVDFELST